jgi:CBS domain-containing protein
MIPTEFIVPTAVATPGFTVDALFRECSENGVPGIPFLDASGRITGKASIQHILKETCVPPYLLKHASLLDDRDDCLSIPIEKAREVLSLAVDPFVLADSAIIGPESSVAKALAVMDQNNTTYLFVMDGDSYLGCISIMGIAQGVIHTLENQQ